jgi:chemotaxis protein methyltransferase CheR
MTPSERGLGRTSTLIAERLGLDFPESRWCELERGLGRACQSSGTRAPEDYLGWLASLPGDDPEWGRLAGYLTVGETHFFRDAACFDALEQRVLPRLIEDRDSAGMRRLRFWSAGCATGEEPYSLAILLDRLLRGRSGWAPTILATDINPRALAVARRGCYRQWALRETPAWVRERYFRRGDGDTFELESGIRGLVTFAPLNLAGDSYPALLTNTAGMDLILCRNVLMYFTREAQQATVGRLRRALMSEGWLVLSPAEASADLLRPLVPVNFPGAILYQRLDRPAPPEPPRSRWADLDPTWSVTCGVAPQPAFSPPRGARSASPPAREAEAPAEPASLLARARALADEGKLEQAEALCTSALARNRLDSDAHLLLAAIYQERGEIPGALEALRRVIYLTPDSAAAHFLFGSLLLRHGEPRKARRCMETAAHLLSACPRDEPVAGAGGLTAGRLLETTRLYLEPVG